MDRPRTVFILGAGASEHAGAPLMANFLDVATDIRKTAPLEDDEKKAFDVVFEARAQLDRIFAKSRLDLDNIEGLFAAFEMAELLHTGGTEIDGMKLTDAIRQLILTTLEETVQFKYDASRVMPTDAYRTFAELLHGHFSKTKRPISIITFNYDLALDYALSLGRLPFDYCLDAPPQSTEVIRYLKLHGSLNHHRLKAGGFVGD